LTDTLLFLKENPYAWGGLLLLTISLAFIGIILSIKKKQLLFITKTEYVIEKSKIVIDNLSIKYGNEQIENLMVTKVALVNRGNVTILNNDIPVASPLYIVVPDECKILSATILAESNTSSLTTVIYESSSRIVVNFDYLDKKDGVVLQVIHTGTSDQISFLGKLKGGNILTPSSEYDSAKSRFKKNLAIYIIKHKGLVFLLALIAIIIITNYSAIFENFASTTHSNSQSVSPSRDVFLIALSVLTGVVSALSRTNTWSFLPRSLRKYFK